MNLEEQLKNIKEERNALISKGNDAKSIEELDKIELDIRKKDLEIKRLESEISNEDVAKRKKEDEIPQGGLNPMATYRKGQMEVEERNEDEDIFGSLEYRKAFKDYVMNGTPIPQEFRAEAQVNNLGTAPNHVMSVVGDVGAIIPTTILNRVIEDITTEGKILGRVTQTSYQGGVRIPLADIKPTAQWLSNENNVSVEQKAEMNASISFGYHVLEAKVAIGLLTATVSLAVFEQTIVNQLRKAMIRTIEAAIVSGAGATANQPKGFTTYTNLPTNQQIDFTAGQVTSVAGWARAEAELPEEYEANGVYLMNKHTWEKYLNGMVDSAGQKIGLGKINERGQKILNGREVITTDAIKGFDAAAKGEIFAVLINLSDYMLNSNLSMYYKKYFNEDLNKWVHKSLMIVDGQMTIGENAGKLIGSKGLLYLKKA